MWRPGRGRFGRDDKKTASIRDNANHRAAYLVDGDPIDPAVMETVSTTTAGMTFRPKRPKRVGVTDKTKEAINYLKEMGAWPVDL